jgi:hypothetical protein
MVSVTFPAGEVMGSIAAPCKCRTMRPERTLATKKKSRKLKTGLHGFLQNCVQCQKRCARRQAGEPVPDRALVRRCLRCAPLSTSNQWYPQSNEIALNSGLWNVEFNNLMQEVLRIIIASVHVGAIKIYVTTLEDLRTNERGVTTGWSQITTKIDGFFEFHPLNDNVLFLQGSFQAHTLYDRTWASVLCSLLYGYL